MRALRLVLALSLTAPLGLACDEPDAAPAPDGQPDAPQPPKLEMVPRRILGTPVVVSVPASWTVENKTAPMPERAPGDEIGPITLRSRTLLSARAPGDDAGRPWLMVLHDAHLPKQADATRYLDAQRASNRATHANLKHVDAERSSIEGRGTYRVRDQWSVDVASESTLFAQEALLIVDDKTNPEERHGYAIVLTRLDAHRKAEPALGRKILDSVRFVD
jgi:hypothetical protein